MWTLVTGAGGFVGGHMVRHLFKRGIPVAALQRTARAIEGMPDEDGAGFRRLTGDLTALFALDLPIDNVVHLAALINAPGTTATEFATGNVATTAGVVRLAQAQLCARVIALSTISVYGYPEGATTLTEDMPVTAPTAYGASKYLAELMLKDLAAQARVTVLRSPGIIGRGANPNLVVRLCATAVRDEEMLITNPDAPFNSTVHVSDICRLVEQLLTAETKPAFDVVNVSSASPLAIRELVQLIIKRLGSGSTVAVKPDGAPPRLIDIKRLCTGYGFEPLSVAEAVERYTSECISR